MVPKQSLRLRNTVQLVFIAFADQLKIEINLCLCEESQNRWKAVPSLFLLKQKSILFLTGPPGLQKIYAPPNACLHTMFEGNFRTSSNLLQEHRNFITLMTSSSKESQFTPLFRTCKHSQMTSQRENVPLPTHSTRPHRLG